MFNSIDYYKICTLNNYIDKLNEIEIKMKDFNINNKIKIKLCNFNDDINKEIKEEALNKLKNDYFINKDCSYWKGNTLFDICLKKNINHFKLIFINLGTKNILKSLYDYLNKLPNQIKIKNDLLSNKDLIINYYFKYYINLYFCYDFIIILLENYKNLNQIDQLNCLEILINDLLIVLERIYN